MIEHMQAAVAPEQRSEEHPSTVPAVSVIVPCRNEADHIEGFLESLAAQEPVEGGLEILIADGMSDDGTRDIIGRFAAQHPGVRLVDNPARFAAPGLNQAIAAAQAPVILRMDVHTRYAPDYVRECLAVLEETGADNVGGAARTMASSYMQQANALAYASRFSVGGARFHDEGYEGPVDTLPYGCWRRELFERVGLFDEQLVRNQDDEHNLRIHRAGGRVWQSRRIRSWYAPRSSIGAIYRQYMQYGYWKVAVIRKHRVPASWRHLVPGLFLLALLATGITALLRPDWWWLPAGLAGSYLAASLLASLAAAGFGARLRYFPVLPAVYAAYHFGYGIGFLRGLFAFRRRGDGEASSGFDAITR